MSRESDDALSLPGHQHFKHMQRFIDKITKRLLIKETIEYLTQKYHLNMDVSQKLDSILIELGGFGRYQAFQFILLTFIVIFSASASIGYVFTAGTVPHRCLVTQCGDVGDRSEFLPPWWEDAIPPNKDGEPSSCVTYVPLSNDSCSFDNSSELSCDEWVYDGPETTILTEFTLTCSENAWKLALVGTMNSVGTLIGLPLLGLIGDRYGRKIALLASISGASFLGVIKSFSTAYAMFITFEFFEAVFLSYSYGLSFILALEQVHPKRRELAGGVIVWAYSLGMVWLGCLAWIYRDWQSLLLTLYIPVLVCVAYFWVCLPESLRWCMAQGRLKFAREQIIKTAKKNKATISIQLEHELSTWDSNNGPKIKEDEGEGLLNALRQVVKSRTLLLNVANCSFCWISNVLVYYGLSLNSVSLAGSDSIYLNFVLVSVVEMPAYLIAWVGMKYIGRKRTLSTLLILSGITCFTSPFVPQNVEWAQVAMYVFGKLTISGSFDVLYVFTTEIFPTNLRSSLMSFCSMIGRFGSILATLTPLLAAVSPVLTMVIFGIVALLSGFLSLFFPETKGRSLPDSVVQAESLD